MCILLFILRHKIGAKMFEPKIKMKDLSGKVIEPQFSEFKYCHEVGCKPDLILY